MKIEQTSASNLEAKARTYATSSLHDTTYMTPELIEARHLGFLEGARHSAIEHQKQLKEVIMQLTDFISAFKGAYSKDETKT